MLSSNSLRLAQQQYSDELVNKGFEGFNISFSNISMGACGLPKDQAADIAVDTVRNYFGTTKAVIKPVNLFDDKNDTIYKQLIGEAYA